jgi:hypothetical protein
MAAASGYEGALPLLPGAAGGRHEPSCRAVKAKWQKRSEDCSV